MYMITTLIASLRNIVNQFVERCRMTLIRVDIVGQWRDNKIWKPARYALARQPGGTVSLVDIVDCLLLNQCPFV